MNAHTISGKLSIRALRIPHSNALQRIWDHRFYTGMSFAIAAIVFTGFGRTYYLKAQFHTPELTPLLHIHGAINTLWILSYVAQNVLVHKRKTGIHRRLGWAIAGLAVPLVILAVPVAIRSVRLGHFAPAHDAYTSLLVFSFRNLFVFALLLSASIYWGQDIETHKRLALLAAVALFRIRQSADCQSRRH